MILQLSAQCASVCDSNGDKASAEQPTKRGRRWSFKVWPKYFSDQSFPSLRLIFDIIVKLLLLWPNTGNRIRPMNKTKCICQLKSKFWHDVQSIVHCILNTILSKYHNGLNMILSWCMPMKNNKIHHDYDFSSPTIVSVEKNKQVLKERFLLTNQAPDSQVLFRHSLIILDWTILVNQKSKGI